MKLLIVTQIVDVDDPVLGFFHRWITEYAKHFDRIEVICLKEGRHDLPSHVRVHSLGKEHGTVSSIRYALRFMSLVWKLRKEYDGVLVHMNAEYVVLAGIAWRIWRKRVALWYNHTVGSLALKCAVPFTDRIFHTSPHAYTARYINAKQMPAGIDVELFVPIGEELISEHTVYFQGRVAPAKRVHTLIGAIGILRSEGLPAKLTVVGPEDPDYAKTLRASAFMDAVSFLGPKRNEETPALYRAHAVSVNLTDDGNFDKTVLESLACGTPAIVASVAFRGVVPDSCIVPEAKEDASVLAKHLREFFQKSPAERELLSQQGRENVVRLHSLPALAKKLRGDYTATV